MPGPTDHELLADFVRNGSEAAFSELVRRYVALVYSTGLRFSDNPHHAEEITQAVFIILARKAGKLSSRVVLSGWLYQTARLMAANFVKYEIRRRRREQEVYMQSTLPHPESADWDKIAPLLDTAMGKLGETDRNALVMRFFENRTAAEIGAALRMNEEAVRKRVQRALEKLRKFFSDHGIDSTAETIAGAISANSIQAVPATLVKSVTAAAVAKGAAASTSTLTLIKGALKIMAWSKAKTAMVIGLVAILTTGTTTLVIKKVLDRDAWANDPKYWSLNNPPLASYPPILILRPTRFAKQGGLVGNGNRYVGRNLPIQELVAIAYGYFDRSAQIIFPAVLPQDGPQSGYDLLLTLPNDPKEALRNAITKKFGLVGHIETILTNVLVEKVVNPHAPGLKRSSPAEQSGMNGGYRSVTIRNQPMDIFLAGNVEQEIGQPVLNETGLTGRYDMQIQWRPIGGETDQNAFERAMRDQLGIELVPTNMPVQMLVVEAEK